MDAAELGAELSRAFSAHPFLSTNKGSRMVMRILEVRAHAGAPPPPPPPPNLLQPKMLLLLMAGKHEVFCMLCQTHHLISI